VHKSLKASTSSFLAHRIARLPKKPERNSEYVLDIKSSTVQSHNIDSGILIKSVKPDSSEYFSTFELPMSNK
jgi:preprotein translocase subunit Sss1